MAITAPRNFAGEADDHDSVTLTWRLCDDAVVRIYRADTDPWNSFRQVGTVASGQPGTFNDTGLSADTEYAYYAAALDGATELRTDAIRVTTDPAPSPPTAPSALTSGGSTTSTVTCTWTDNSNNETEFQLRLVEVVSGRIWFWVVGPNVTTGTRGGLPEGTLFRATVRARNQYGFSAYSSSILVATKPKQVRGSGPNPLLPETPHIPTAFAVVVQGEEQATFSWTDNAHNENFYRLVLLLGDGSRLRHIDLPADTTSFTVSDLRAGTSYGAVLEAWNQDGVGTDDDGLTCRPGLLAFTTDAPQRPLPSPPINVNATEVGTGAVVKITLDASASNGDTVSIYRSVPPGAASAIVEDLLPLMTVYYDDTVSAGTTYRYYATATNSRGESDPSDTDDVTTTAPADSPGDPFAHTLEAVDSDTLMAQWAMASAVHDSFKLEISSTSDSGPWSTVSDTIPAQSRAFVIDGLTANTQYWTQVTAQADGFGDSAPSNVATATTDSNDLIAAPTGPVITEVVHVVPTSARIYFTATDRRAVTYRAYLSTGGSYSANGAAVNADQNYVDISSLTASTDYLVKIRATNDGGTGDSDPLAFTTLGNGGTPGLAARSVRERHYRRGFVAADVDVTIPIPTERCELRFSGESSDGTDGPFAHLYVGASKVSPDYVDGHCELPSLFLDGDETVTVQITGSGSGPSLYRLVVRSL